LKAQSPETAVVMLSTHDTPYHRLAAKNAGAAEYIAKHDMETQLESAVERVLDSRRRRPS
jgi:DNA-binding NarL/FixJ family response regulator